MFALFCITLMIYFLVFSNMYFWKLFLSISSDVGSKNELKWFPKPVQTLCKIITLHFGNILCDLGRPFCSI